MTSLLVAIGVGTGGAKAPPPTYVKGGLAPPPNFADFTYLQRLRR